MWPLGEFVVALLYSLEVQSRLLCLYLPRYVAVIKANNNKDVHLLFPIFKRNLISSNVASFLTPRPRLKCFAFFVWTLEEPRSCAQTLIKHLSAPENSGHVYFTAGRSIFKAFGEESHVLNSSCAVGRGNLQPFSRWLADVQRLVGAQNRSLVFFFLLRLLECECAGLCEWQI